jgi:hypothetical protein
MELKKFVDSKKPDNTFKTNAQRKAWVLKTFGYELQKDGGVENALPCFVVGEM